MTSTHCLGPQPSSWSNPLSVLAYLTNSSFHTSLKGQVLRAAFPGAPLRSRPKRLLLGLRALPVTLNNYTAAQLFSLSKRDTHLLVLCTKGYTYPLCILVLAGTWDGVKVSSVSASLSLLSRCSYWESWGDYTCRHLQYTLRSKELTLIIYFM